MPQNNRRAAVVGAFEHPLRLAPDYTNLRFIGESARAALDDAGLPKSAIDGLAMVGDASVALYVAEYLDLKPRWMDTTTVGGSSFVMLVLAAARAVLAGEANCVLIVYGSTARSGRSALGTTARGVYMTDPMFVDDAEQYLAPYGAVLASQYGMVATKHMARFGTTAEQLAEVAVTMRSHAALNPLARYREPITVDDVLSSPMVSTPLHRLDSCVITDGGGALIVAAPEVVADTASKPIWIVGGATAVTHLAGGMRDPLDIAGNSSGPRAFAATGVRHEEVDFCMIYDSFTISVITALEGLGFCKPGEGGPFVENGRISRDGALPVNPDGGALSNHHPGRRGIFLVIEAVRQLRGACGERQLGAPSLALCHGIGGYLVSRHSAVTAFLSTERP